jgi:hypothetical protein
LLDLVRRVASHCPNLECLEVHFSNLWTGLRALRVETLALSVRIIQFHEHCLGEMETLVIAEHPTMANVVAMAPLYVPDVGCVSFRLSTYWTYRTVWSNWSSTSSFIHVRMIEKVVVVAKANRLPQEKAEPRMRRIDVLILFVVTFAITLANLVKNNEAQDVCSICSVRSHLQFPPRPRF